MSKEFKKRNPGESNSFRFHHYKVYEDYAYVLDHLPYGRSINESRTGLAASVVQLIGEKYFTLLEAQLKHGTTVSPQEKMYIGREKRDKALRVVGRISFNDLTAIAKSEIESVLNMIVQQQEQRFVEFFNRSSAITPRMHALELLPGIGKKSMWDIIEEREKRSFTSFHDIAERTGLLDPSKTIVKRILEELGGDSKYRIFTR